MHKKMAATILNLKVEYRSFLSKNMTDKCINSKLYRNRKLCANAQLKYREDVVLAAIFFFCFFEGEWLQW